MATVAEKTIKTSFWSGIERFANLGVNLLVQLLLARILTPSDFGVVAMMTVFVGISQAVSECGFTNALIRKRDCNQRDYSTAFYVNFGLSIILYAILFVSAPYIASFYKMPLVKSLLRVYAFVFIFEALRIVQYSKLCKRLDFKTIARISSLSVFLSGVIGVVMAYMNMGTWALVGQLLSASVIYFLLIAVKEKWMPTKCFDKESFRYLWGFGSKMLLTGIISRLYSNINSLVIGRFYNSSVLGIFNNGQRYGLFYPNLIDNVFVKNSLPIMADLQDNKTRLCEVYRKFVQLVSFVTFPACMVIVVLAKPIVVLLLTEKWVGAVPYLQLFALTALYIPANSINLNVLQVMGRTDLTLKAEIVKKSIGFIVVFALVSFGPLYLAIGSSMLCLFANYVNLYCAKIVLGLSMRQQISDLGGIFLSSIVCAILAFFVTLLNIDYTLQILCGCVVSIFAYVVIIHYFTHYELFSQLLTIMQNRKK